MNYLKFSVLNSNIKLILYNKINLTDFLNVTRGELSGRDFRDIHEDVKKYTNQLNFAVLILAVGIFSGFYHLTCISVIELTTLLFQFIYESGKEFAYKSKKPRHHTLISAWPKRDNKHVLLFNFAV